MSKSGKRRQASAGTGKDHPAADSAKNDNKEPGGDRKLLIIACAAIACVIIGGFWLISQPGFLGDPIVGTWTDQNKYWAYAYYGNGSFLELGWYTHKTADSTTHVPVYLTGKWVNLGDDQYSIAPDGQNNTTFIAVMDGNTMSVINTTTSVTHKISNIANVELVDFNYAP